MKSVSHTNILPAEFLASLGDIVGQDNILLASADCWPYGQDNSRRHHPPDAVIFATMHNQVKDIIKQCNQYQIPIVARGRGTGTTGATVPVTGGVVLSLERMDQIIKINTDDRIMIVQPGVTNLAVQEKAAEHGFFWPPDPTSAAYCTIGGNLAYNSAGPRAVKYGTPRENTLGLRVITGSGEEIRTGVYTTKGVVGYDLTRLIIGSEGTLGIITEATLKLIPLQESKSTLQVIYQDIHSAAAAVSRIMAQAVIPYALEFIDGSAIDMIRNYSNIEFPSSAGAMLMIEIDGSDSCLDMSTTAIENAANGPGVLSVRKATTSDEINELWRVRKALSPALRNIAPKKINEDVVVPVSNLPQLIDGLEQLSQEFNITIVNFGHAGNGNIHVNLLLDPDDPVQLENGNQCLDRMFDLVLDLNGSLSGEHGVGIEKRAFVGREIEPAALNLMQSIKSVFDPNNILNPGKMFPEKS